MSSKVCRQGQQTVNTGWQLRGFEKDCTDGMRDKKASRKMKRQSTENKEAKQKCELKPREMGTADQFNEIATVLVVAVFALPGPTRQKLLHGNEHGDISPCGRDCLIDNLERQRNGQASK